MLTVEETIDQDLVDTLRGVSSATGYATTLTVEDADPADGNRERDGLCVVVPQDPEPADDGPINQDRFTKPYEITVWVVVPEAFSDTLRTRLARAHADVVKALTYTRQSYTRGARALWTRVDLSARNYAAGQSAATVTVTATVYYATAKGDPFTNPYTTA